MPNDSTRTVLVALGAGLGVALAKVGAAVFTGSAALAAEAAHSLADSGNDLSLYVAQRRSSRHPDDQHPLGYGREAYFWALIAALGVFVIAAAFSLREGIDELIHPSVTSSFAVAYVVLAISTVLDLVSFRQSTGQMIRKARHYHREFLEETRMTSDPSLRAVFVEDAVSVSGDVLALAALALNQITGSSIPQGVAAVIIALVLIRVSLRLIKRSHDFLVGSWSGTAGVGGGPQGRDAAGFTQPLPVADEERVRAFVLGYPGVSAIRELLFTFVGPGQVWIVARINIDEGLRGGQVRALVRGIESGIKHEAKEVYRVDVVPIGEAQPPKAQALSSSLDPERGDETLEQGPVTAGRYCERRDAGTHPRRGYYMAQEAQRAAASQVAGAAQRDKAGGDDYSRRWLILGVVCLGQLMVVLDATVVNIALPVAQHDLVFSDADRQWVVTAYSLAFGGLLLLGGRLADLVGRKRMLILGMVGFALASALGGAAQNFSMLLIARAIQGAFGAMLAPAALSTLTVTFTNPAERGKAFGIFGAIAGAGGAVGLLLGGVLTEYLSWRWCLYVNVIFSVVAVVAAIRLLSRDVRDPSVRLDPPGTVLVVAGLVAFVYGLSEADIKGWGAPLTIGLLVAGVILLALFALTERRVAHPLLPLRIVLDRFRGGAYLSIGLSAIGLFGVFLFLTYYLEETLRYSPVVTGLAFLPLIGGLVVSSTTSSGLLMPRLGPRILIPLGLLIAAGGMVILASQLGVNTSYAAWILPALIVIGLGLGLVFGCGLNTATYGAAPADAGVASAMVNTCQQVGGSIGTALLNTIAASALTSYLVTHGHSPAALAEAAVHSYVVAFWVAAAIFAAAAVVCALVLKSGILTQKQTVTSAPSLPPPHPTVSGEHHDAGAGA